MPSKTVVASVADIGFRPDLRGSSDFATQPHTSVNTPNQCDFPIAVFRAEYFGVVGFFPGIGFGPDLRGFHRFLRFSAFLTGKELFFWGSRSR